MGLRIQKNNVLLPEELLLDMEIELWDREFELGMPDWYWEHISKSKAMQKVVQLKNKIKSIQRRINTYSEDYDEKE